MGFWDSVRSAVSFSWWSPRVEYLTADAHAARVAEAWGEAGVVAGLGSEWTVAELWRTQPHLRTVVTFLARNIAQCGLHVFERVDETDRRRSRVNPLAQALADPGDGLTGYDLVFALVGDRALYDRAYWLPWFDAEGRWRLRRLPPAWVSERRLSAFGPKTYLVSHGGESVELDAAQVIAFGGYHPGRVDGCSSPVEALREILREQIEASKYRNQVWSRGGRVSAVIERPAGAPAWSEAAANRFREDWYAQYTGSGPGTGGTPILEDGMALKRIDFSAHDQQWVEGAKLAFATVASAYHVNPTMVGLLDNANFSNVREFRRMLYGDTLGPEMASIEATVNTFALAALGMDRDVMYAEFNISEKLQGSFEEQTQALQSAVGRPWMTADEARARLNLSALGGDAAQLVTPLNVLVGGQASPRDSAPKQRVDVTLRTKGAPTRAQVDRIERVLAAFFARQGKSVLSAVGAGLDWWDGDRWDRELAADLLKVAHTIAAVLGAEAAEELGYEPDAYDPGMTVNFLKAVAERRAAGINATTRDQVAEQIDAEDGDPGRVFVTAEGSRAGAASRSLAGYLSSFATAEVARQIRDRDGVGFEKVWVTGPNPRSSHARMDGERVDLEDAFSNGQKFPGDSADAEDAGCNCRLRVEVAR